MTGRFANPCTAQRPALHAWIERRDSGPATRAALDHLERCRPCEQELTTLALTVVTLRRLGSHVSGGEPAPDAWVRLRDRISRPVDRWRWRASLGGLATSAMLVGVLVLPVTLGGPATAENGSELPGPGAEIRREAEYLASIWTGSLPATPRTRRDGAGVVRFYPPEIAQVRKEVPAPPAVGRSAQPI